MANPDLKLAPSLAVSRAIAARTVFEAGTKGSGKTYTGGVLAEELLGALLDPSRYPLEEMLDPLFEGAATFLCTLLAEGAEEAVEEDLGFAFCRR